MSLAQKYIGIVRSRGERQLPLQKVYHNLQQRDLFLSAYGKIYGNKGATTPGTDSGDTVDGMSLERIEQIIAELKQGTYRWQPVRRAYIPKRNGRRPLGLPGWKDKLLQEVIRMILEAYYEPQFSDRSHGFRPTRGCHTALQEIARTWHGTKWFIEGDIRDCFNQIDHPKLVEIIEQDIPDRRFLKLLRGMLTAGYLEDWRYYGTYSGVPQGGICSPILSNIYLAELDKFVEEELIPQYTRGKKRKLNPEYVKLAQEIRKARRRGRGEELKGLYTQLRAIPSVDPQDEDHRRLHYVRYADDILLGFAGPKREAEQIKQELADFLADVLNLELSAEKTLITHAATDRARFLGYDIHCPYVNKISRRRTATQERRSRLRAVSGKILLSVPDDVVRRHVRRYTRKGKPIHRAELRRNSDFEIITLYNQEFQGLANYYCMAHNVSTKMYTLKYIAAQSLAKTLATKFKKKTTWAYRTYQHKFETGVTGFRKVIYREPPKAPLVAKFGAERILYIKNPSYLEDKIPKAISRRTELVTRLLANQCELCGSTTSVEVHHVRALKDVRKRYQGRRNPPDWANFMMARNRKTIVVCHQCHSQITWGRYDGPKVIQH